MRNTQFLAVTSLLTLVLGGCSSETIEGGTNGLDAVIAEIDPVALPPESGLTLVKDETKTEVRDAGRGAPGRFTCRYRTFSGTTHYQDLVSFDPLSDVLWPGALVQGRSLPEGLLAPIGLARTPAQITMTNLNVSGGELGKAKYSRSIAQPSHASMQEGIMDILASAKEVNFSAKASFTAERVYSMSHAAYHAGLSLKWLSNELRARFDKESWLEKTNFIVKFSQAYYTVSFETPQSPTSVFASSVTAQDAAAYMGKDNPPGYISSIVYGRMLFLRIESSRSEEEVSAAIDAAIKTFVGGVSGQLSTTHQQVLDSSKLTLFALGGSADDVIEIAANGVGALKSYLTQGANFSPSSPGVPISYTVRSLRDNQILKVAYTTDYQIPECALNVNKLRVRVDSIQFVDNGEMYGKGENNYRIWVNDGTREHLLAQGYERAHDGDTFNLGNSVDLLLPQQSGASLALHFWADDEGDKSTAAYGAHRFDVDTARWNKLGANQIFGATDNLNVNVRYSVEVVQ